MRILNPHEILALNGTFYGETNREMDTFQYYRYRLGNKNTLLKNELRKLNQKICNGIF